MDQQSESYFFRLLAENLALNRRYLAGYADFYNDKFYKSRCIGMNNYIGFQSEYCLLRIAELIQLDHPELELSMLEENCDLFKKAVLQKQLDICEQAYLTANAASAS